MNVKLWFWMVPVNADVQVRLLDGGNCLVPRRLTWWKQWKQSWILSSAIGSQWSWARHCLIFNAGLPKTTERCRARLAVVHFFQKRVVCMKIVEWSRSFNGNDVLTYHQERLQVSVSPSDQQLPSVQQQHLEGRLCKCRSRKPRDALLWQPSPWAPTTCRRWMSSFYDRTVCKLTRKPTNWWDSGKRCAKLVSLAVAEIFQNDCFVTAKSTTIAVAWTRFAANRK